MVACPFSDLDAVTTLTGSSVEERLIRITLNYQDVWGSNPYFSIFCWKFEAKLRRDEQLGIGIILQGNVAQGWECFQVASIVNDLSET